MISFPVLCFKHVPHVFNLVKKKRLPQSFSFNNLILMGLHSFVLHYDIRIVVSP